MDRNQLVARRLRKQVKACELLGSFLYARLLEAAADDADEGGIVAEVMQPLAEAAPGTAIALRFMGAVHRMVLEGRIPELNEYYPSVGGSRSIDEAPPVFLEALRTHAGDIQALLDRPVQTNEVGRSAALLGGFLEVARSRPELRVLEIGSSAGLNLRWDHYRYEHGDEAWGDPGSPVHMSSFESAPDLSVAATVVERAGCDPDPIDPSTKEGRLTLSSFVWPDQTWRWALLQGALDAAARVPATVEKEGAASWLEKKLAVPVDGVATVVFHSIMWQYMPPAEQKRVEELLVRQGAEATESSPLAWLRMEPPVEEGDPLGHVHLTRWPGGDTKWIARAGYHGRPIIWMG